MAERERRRDWTTLEYVYKRGIVKIVPKTQARKDVCIVFSPRVAKSDAQNAS